MKVSDFLVLLKPTIEKMINSNINPKDVQYLDLYGQFNKLKDEGNKTEWITAHLSSEYKVSRATIFNIIKRLDANLS